VVDADDDVKYDVERASPVVDDDVATANPEVAVTLADAL